MDLIEELKSQKPLDKLIIYMLFHGLSVTATARRASVSRDYVYKAIDRSRELLLKYDLLDTSE